MHAFIRSIAPCLLGTAVATFAQSPAKPDSAEAAWLNVTTLATPVAPAKPAGPVAAGKTAGVTNGSTDASAKQSTSPTIGAPANLNDKAVLADESKSSLQLQIERFQQASQSANAFYATYPKHAQVAAAKKIEAFTALQSVQLGDASYAAKALQIGQAYRADKSIPAKDRFDVALTMEALVLSPSLRGERLIDSGPAYEKLADTLYAELGGTPETYGTYLSIVRTADLATSLRVARKLQQQKMPDWVQAEAQRVLDRYAMIGKPVDLTLTTVDWQSFNLKSLTGQPTVIFVWDASSDAGVLASLIRFKPLVPPKVRWIDLVLGRTYAKPAKIPAQIPPTEIRCFERPGFDSPAAVGLKLPQTPYVYVLNSRAELTGYGRMEDLPELIKDVTP